jgi:hypothetical protein
LSRRSKAWKVAAKALVLVAVFVGLDVALSYALLPYGSHTELAWRDYYSCEDEIDAIYVGSSTTEVFLDPDVIDPVLGTDSFNLALGQGTPGASLDTLEAVLARRGSSLKRVVLGVSYNDIVTEESAASRVAMAQARGIGQLPGYKVAQLWHVAADPAFVNRPVSLGALAPWTILGVDPDEVGGNVSRRLSGMSAEESAEVYTPEEHYMGRGFSTNTSEKMHEDNLSDDEVVGGMTEDARERITRIAEVCEENGIELDVIVPPLPTYRIVMYGDTYVENMGEVKRICESHGGHYLDFNLQRDFWSEFSEDDFWDNAHFDLAAATRYSEQVAGYLSRVDAGEDVSGEFYSYDAWDEYLGSLTHDAPVFVDAYVEGDGVHVDAYTYSGPNQRVEFKVVVTDAATGEVVAQRDYDADPDFSFEPPASGTYDVRVYDRIAGTDVEYDHYSDATVRYESGR